MWQQHWEGCCCGILSFIVPPAPGGQEGQWSHAAIPVLPSTFPSLPKDKQDGWSSLLQGDASFSSHPPVIHVKEQPPEFWQLWLLQSRLHP